ncbi:MAG: hypothetical protein R2706_17685 [Acidimicrobiales bacterium]
MQTISIRSIRRGALVASVALAITACGDASPPAELGFADTPTYYGDNVLLDLYWEACSEAGGLACDELWRLAPIGSEYEAFAADCGGRGPAIRCLATASPEDRRSAQAE